MSFGLIAAAGAAGRGVCAYGDTIASSSTEANAATCFISALESYNQRVSTRRPISVALLAGLIAANPAAQTPSLDDVLKRSASYVGAFRKQLSGIVAEEVYRQEIANTGRLTNPLLVNPRRQLKSALLLIKPVGSDRYVELRDVFEVDGAPLHDRQGRLESFLRDRTASADAQIQAIIAASARYNIGRITRNVNTPLMTLQFLDAEQQSRFRFKHVDKSKPVFTDERDKAANDAPVFRVATEMWTVEYRERAGNTIIRTPTGGRMPAHGRFWLDPATGSILISELVVDGGGVIATVTVSYQSDPVMGFLVPIEMRESYVGHGERITGHAQYSKFRAIR
jgi:hypothetical protein